MTKARVKQQASPNAPGSGEGKALAGIRALRGRLADDIPAYAGILNVEDEAEHFCREVRLELRAQRKRQARDQNAVAALLDMTQSAVSKIESGEGDLGLKTVFRYAHALGLRPVCVFVSTGTQLLEPPPPMPGQHMTRDDCIALAETAKAVEELQVSFVREMSEKVTGLARTLKEQPCLPWQQTSSESSRDSS